MSSAAVSSAYTTSPTGESSSSPHGNRRRSLFKPSTWSSKKHRDEIRDGAAPAGVDGPHGRAHIDAVETGAPLTDLVAAEEKREAEIAKHSHQLLNSHQQGHAYPTASQQQQDATTKAESNTATKPGSGLDIHPDPLGRIVFFMQDRPNFFLSNSASSHPVHYNSIRYPTAEHLFQALKFLPSHPDIAAKIRRAKNPLDAIRIARANTALLPPGWISDGLNVKTMHQVVLAKFSQHANLTQALLETEDRELVCGSPSDVFWGIGEGRGRNVLGKVLMDVREVLRANSGLGWGSAAKTM